MTTKSTAQVREDDDRDAHSLSASERNKLYGEFDWRPIGSNGDIKILGDWAKDNVAPVHIPQLVGVDTGSGPFSGDVQWHRAGRQQLVRVFAEIEARGLKHLIIHWGGSFVPRMVRGSTKSLSPHAWATALDINVKWNWLGEIPAPKGAKGSVIELVPIFKTHGFFWGGDFKNRKDGMHFELCKKLSYDTPAVAAKLVVDDKWKGAIDCELRGGIAYASIKEMSEAVGLKWEGEDDLVPVGQFMVTNGRLVKWDANQKKVYAYRR